MIPAEKINRPEHIQDIIKYTNLEDKVDATKLDLHQARGILQTYHRYGEVSKTNLDQMGIPKYAIKKKEQTTD